MIGSIQIRQQQISYLDRQQTKPTTLLSFAFRLLLFRCLLIMVEWGFAQVAGLSLHLFQR